MAEPDSPKQDTPRSYLYYRHKLAVRVMHWINVLSVFVLLMSGLQIFNAHPMLYWGKSSYTGDPPILASEKRPTRQFAVISPAIS